MAKIFLYRVLLIPPGYGNMELLRMGGLSERSSL